MLLGGKVGVIIVSRLDLGRESVVMGHHCELCVPDQEACLSLPGGQPTLPPLSIVKVLPPPAP